MHCCYSLRYTIDDYNHPLTKSYDFTDSCASRNSSWGLIDYNRTVNRAQLHQMDKAKNKTPSNLPCAGKKKHINAVMEPITTLLFEVQ